MRIDVKSIKIGELIFDLSKVVSIPKDKIEIITTFFLGKETNSEAILFKDGLETSTKNYLSTLQNLGISITEQQLQEYIIKPETIQVNIDEFIKTKSITTPTNSNSSQDLNSKLQSLTNGLSPDELNNFNKLADILVKIKNLDKEVSDYQNQKSSKEKITAKITELQNLQSTLNQKLASVQTLLDGKKKIESEIEKVKNENSHHESDQINKIKEERIDQLNQKLSGGFKQASGHKPNYEEEPDPLKLKHKWILALVGVQVFLTLAYFLISFNVGLLIIGLGLAMLFLVIFVVIQVTTKEKIKKIEQPSQSQIVLEQDVQLNTTQSEDMKMVKGAYLNALIAENQNIDSIIAKSLGNETLEAVQQQIGKSAEELELTKKSLVDLESKNLDIDSYYKKRRELDILKIEKENLEFSTNLPVKPDDEYINLLANGSSQQNALADNIFLPVVIVSKDHKFDELIETYNNIRQVIVLYENP